MLFRNIVSRGIWIPVIIGILGGVAGIIVGSGHDTPVSKDILVKARQYAYDPPKIEANLGDTIHFQLASMDVVHGFFLEGYDVDAEIYPGVNEFKIRKPSEGHIWEEVEGFTVVLNRRGKFRYRCSHTCGTMHPFMQGELIVHPNTPYHAGLGGLVGVTIGLLLLMSRNLKGLKVVHKSNQKPI